MNVIVRTLLVLGTMSIARPCAAEDAVRVR